MEPGTLKIKSELDILIIFMYEVLGIFFFVNAVCLADGDSRNLIIISVLFVCINLACKVSGAHFNAAVTLGIYIIEAKWLENIKIVLIYFLADILGATLGLLSAYFIKNEDPLILRPEDPNESWLKVLALEFMFSFLFMIIIFHVKYQPISTTSDGCIKSMIVVVALYGTIGCVA